MEIEREGEVLEEVRGEAEDELPREQRGPGYGRASLRSRYGRTSLRPRYGRTS